jgi:hypothetical protein
MKITTSSHEEIMKNDPKLNKLLTAHHLTLKDIYEGEFNSELISGLMSFHANLLPNIIIHIPNITEKEGLDLLDDVYLLMRNKVQKNLREKEDALSFIETLKKICEEDENA